MWLLLCNSNYIGLTHFPVMNQGMEVHEGSGETSRLTSDAHRLWVWHTL